MIRTFLFILILLLGFTFILKNTDQTVALQYFFGLAARSQGKVRLVRPSPAMLRGFVALAAS